MFEDLLEPEIGRSGNSRIWSLVGGAGGVALGFVCGNVPGALAGGFAGNRLGAIRDAKGKSVGEVFLGLNGDAKAQVSATFIFRGSSHFSGLALTLLLRILDLACSDGQGVLSGRPAHLVAPVPRLPRPSALLRHRLHYIDRRSFLCTCTLLVVSRTIP